MSAPQQESMWVVDGVPMPGATAPCQGCGLQTLEPVSCDICGAGHCHRCTTLIERVARDLGRSYHPSEAVFSVACYACADDLIELGIARPAFRQWQDRAGRRAAT